MCWRYWPLMSCLLAVAAFAETPIYRCTVNGVMTFSDSRCGADAEPVTLDSARLTTFAPVPAAKVDIPKPRRRAVAETEPPNNHKDRCVSIRASIRSIDDKLRSGYTAKQGVRLDERKRSLRRQARELKC